MRVPDIRRATTCVQATSGTDPAEISPITRDLRTRNRDLPTRTGNSTIEQSKQLLCAADVDCGAGRLVAGGLEVATTTLTRRRDIGAGHDNSG